MIYIELTLKTHLPLIYIKEKKNNKKFQEQTILETSLNYVWNITL